MLNLLGGLITLLDSLAGLKNAAVHWRIFCCSILCALLGAVLGNLFGGGAVTLFSVLGFAVGVGVGAVWESDL